ncbi:MAG: SRPBCC family protein [Myxococcota bacterium]
MFIDSTAQATIASEPEVVWDWTWDPRNRWFPGAGPVAAIERVELDELKVGATRTVYTADGATLTETLLEVERGRRHRYRLTGLRPPFAWLVRAGDATWDYTGRDGATHVCWTYRFELTSPLAWPLARLVVVWFGVAQRRALARIAAASVLEGCA